MYFFNDFMIIYIFGMLVLLSLGVFLISKNHSFQVSIAPLLIFGVIWLVGLNIDITNLSDSFESFCISEGFSSSNFNSKNQSYCLDQENGYLIEQEVRLVDDKWLFVKGVSN